jgi:hypothetical protein
MFATAKNSPITFENLETRRLLSASVAHSTALFDHVPTQAITVHVNDVANGATKSARHGRHGRRSSGATEPATDSSVTGWTNVSRDPLFGSDGPSPLDVRQGQAEDCYFLSALGATANVDPGQIENLISERSNGTYDVYLFNGKNFIDENVDGYLPTTSNGSLEYAKLGQDNDTWVAIMEKAFTYFRNTAQAASYTAINFGWPSEALADLGAVAIQNYNLSSLSGGYGLMNQVSSDLNSGLGVELATDSSAGPLVSSHAYAVMNTYEDSSGNSYLLVRNPWGTDGPNANGYQWVNADTLLPHLSVVTSAVV